MCTHGKPPDGDVVGVFRPPNGDKDGKERRFYSNISGISRTVGMLLV